MTRDAQRSRARTHTHTHTRMRRVPVAPPVTLRTMLLLVMLLAALLVLAACGSDDDDAESPGLVAPPASPTDVPTAEPGNTPAGAADDDAPPADDTPATGDTPADDDSAATGTVSVDVTHARVSRGTVTGLSWPVADQPLTMNGALGVWTYDPDDPDQPPQLAAPDTAYLHYSPDGSQVIARTPDGGTGVWDVAGDTLRYTLDASDDEYFTRAVFSPDGDQLAVVLGMLEDDGAGGGLPSGPVVGSPGVMPLNGVLRVLDAADGTQQAQYELPESRVLALGFTPDGTLLLAGSADNLPRMNFRPNQPPEVVTNSDDMNVRVWDVAAGEVVTTMTDPEGPLMLSVFTPDAERLVGIETVVDARTFSTAEDSTVGVWDMTTGARLHVFDPGSRDPLELMALSPDGAQLALVSAVPVTGASGTAMNTITIQFWDVQSGEQTGDIAVIEASGRFGRALSGLAFSPDGARLAASGIGGQVYVWDVATGAALVDQVWFSNRVRALAFALDSTLLAETGYSGIVRVWDLDAGAQEIPLQTTIQTSDSISSLRFLPDSSLAGYTGGISSAMVRWDPATGEQLTFSGSGPRDPRFVAVDAAGERLAVSSGGGTVSIMNPESGSVDEVILAGQQVSALAFSPDGTQLLTGGMDGVILLWNISDHGDPVARLTGHTGAVTSLRFDDAETVVSASVAPVQEGSPLNSEPPRFVDADRTLRTWDLGTADDAGMVRPVETVDLPGAPLDDPVRIAQSFGPPVALYGGVLSPDGSLLAVLDPANNGLTDAGSFTPAATPVIDVYNVATGEIVASLEGHASPIWVLTFSPDSRMLASGDYDGVVYLWRFAAGD